MANPEHRIIVTTDPGSVEAVAERGVDFTNAWPAGLLEEENQLGIYTGQYPERRRAGGIPNWEAIFYSLLEEAGYRRGIDVEITSRPITPSEDQLTIATGLTNGVSRIPLAVSWPGTLTEGTQCARLASHLDIFPTIAAAAGIVIDAYSEVKADGLNLIPVAYGLMPGHHTLFWADGTMRTPTTTTRLDDDPNHRHEWDMWHSVIGHGWL